MEGSYDVVEFEISGQSYAVDIHLTREIVRMMPITPVPHTQSNLAGIINLRGEITKIIDLREMLSLERAEYSKGQKIIVFMPDATNGVHAGMIVDKIHSVIRVDSANIESVDADTDSSMAEYVKGFIKLSLEKSDRRKEGTDENKIIIWLDIEKIMRRLIQD